MADNGQLSLITAMVDETDPITERGVQTKAPA
jgi:hypothetical protein